MEFLKKERSIMKKEKEMVELYRSTNPVEFIKTQYGEISYLEWLKKEKDRILTKSPERIVEIRTKDDGKVSLWVDDVGEDIHVRNRNIYRKGKLK